MRKSKGGKHALTSPMCEYSISLARRTYVVADALSKQQLHAAEEEEAESCAVGVHSEVLLTHTIETTIKPLNCFQNQIVLKEARFLLKRSFILFGKKRHHLIGFTCREFLLDELENIIIPRGVNVF